MLWGPVAISSWQWRSQLNLTFSCRFDLKADLNEYTATVMMRTSLYSLRCFIQEVNQFQILFLSSQVYQNLRWIRLVLILYICYKKVSQPLWHCSPNGQILKNLQVSFIAFVLVTEEVRTTMNHSLHHNTCKNDSKVAQIWVRRIQLVFTNFFSLCCMHLPICKSTSCQSRCDKSGGR